MDRPRKDSTNKQQAIEEIADAIRKVFMKYSRGTRDKAWEKLTSKKGIKEIEKLLVNPQRSLGTVRTLWSESELPDFYAWLDNRKKML
jgi:hypothetical protein